MSLNPLRSAIAMLRLTPKSMSELKDCSSRTAGVSTA
jgi:hypothetical protein